MFIENVSENVRNALVLMMTGMVGIFVVMCVLMISIAVLSRVTSRGNGKSGGSDKEKE